MNDIFQKGETTMTKQDLKKIRDAEKSISAKKLELEALRYKASGAGAIRYDKDRVQTSENDFMTMAIADAIEIEKQIKEEEEAVESLRGEAYAIVRRMENTEYRAVIEWYYLNGISMENTAIRMNISERTAYYLKEDAIVSFESLQAVSVVCSR